MSNLSGLITRLDEIIASENSEPLTMLGSYVVGAILNDSQELYETNPIVERISDYASDLEVSNGTDKELEEFWGKIKSLTEDLKR